MAFKRRYPIGAELCPGGVNFRVFAKDHKKVDLVLENSASESVILPMKRDKLGFFSLTTKKAREGSLYRFCLSEGNWCADPASRFQPWGPNGPSCVINPKFPWTDSSWRGINPQDHVAYEMHIGTFTQEGTFKSAARELPYLADLGITLVEVMPVNDFPGHFGWGYDGVNLFAPCRLYGSPQDLKEFVNKAHSLKIAVILDVVYNHLGPEGNQLPQFAKEYLSDTFRTDWGPAINFDSPQSRQFFLTNAEYWIKEFHFDGLRLDATPWIFSSTPQHVLQEFTQIIKKAGGRRKTIAVAENEPQDTKLLRSYKEDGYGFDILWNDDFHHSAMVRLTGKREAYYTDYLGSAQEFVSALKYGFLYQGQYYQWQKNPRGALHLELPYHSLMIFLENHDQVANSGFGARLHKKTDPGNYRAMIALLLLSPNTPLLFQGQEFNSSKPFYYFSDHEPALAHLIHQGRTKELAQFPRLGTKEVRKNLRDPANPTSFTECKLDHSEKSKNASTLSLFKDLIHLRRQDPVFGNSRELKVDGAVLNPDAFVIRYFSKKGDDRLLIINFGADFLFDPAPEPLLAPPTGYEFEVLWSSESVVYGGESTPPLFIPQWKVLGHSAMVLKTTPKKRRGK